MQQLVAQISWGHNVRILHYVKEPPERSLPMVEEIESELSQKTEDE